MPEMTKVNARTMLQKTLTRFKKVTGQRVGLTFTWDGGLSILGNNLFTQFIENNSDEVWKALACLDDINSSIPSHELELVSKIESDLSKENVKSLRNMVSWITQKSLGEFKYHYTVYIYKSDTKY